MTATGSHRAALAATVLALATLATPPAAAQAPGRFIESRGAHFRVLFEGPADQALARRCVEILEAAYWRIGGALAVYPSEPVEVILYTLQQFRDVTRSPEWAVGAYDGRIHVPVRGAEQQPNELERVLAHEFTHAVVANVGGPQVPVWLNEGLAVMFEPGGAEDANRVLQRDIPRPRLQTLHRGFGRLNDAQATAAYAMSAVAVERMFQLRGGAGIGLLLRDVAAGAPFAAAFRQRIQIPYDDFERQIAQR